MAAVQEIRMGQRTNGPATILAIGTANPPNETYQVDFPDHYFRITNSQHLTDLKAKFKSMCAKSMIKKRHLHVTEEIVKENPYLIDYTASSLEARQALLCNEVPKLGTEASEKAIKEWGQPKSRITHVVFGTNIYMDTPGADHHLVHLLGLKPSVKRFILRQGGCHAGGTVLRIAKDMAENNPGARVLVVCVEMSSAVSFHAPNTTNLLPNTIFGDGAGALIVGADPDEHTERSIFQLVLTEQTTIPDSTWAIHIRLREMGLVGDIIREIPELISKNIENILRDSFKQIGLNNDWNSIFWVVHPGGPVILDQVEAELGLETRKLEASRHVLSEFGNMLGASVVFVLDEMRSRSLKEGKATTGEGFDWGVLLGFGPGVTIESIVLRSAPIIN